MDFYLAGSLITYDDGSAKRARDTDFIITRYRDDGKPLVMPKNRIVFLYESVNALDLYRSEYQSVVSEDPVVRSNFDVYLDERTLTYVSELCDPAVVKTLFFLHVTPFDHGVLLPERRQHGFDNLDFLFYPHAFSHDRGLLRRSGRIFDGKCMVTITLPNYPIASVATGQYDDDGRIWGVKFYTIDDWRARYDAIVTNEPAASSVFDVYLEEDELTYLKEPCGEADMQPRFFLHVRPIDRNDLPEDRRQHGFDNLDFDFAGRGPIFDGKCMVTISLPDYLIAGIATGQFGGDGRIWSVRFDDWRVRYDAIVTNEPDASSIFDMYLGGDELTYLKEPCGEADTQPRFFLHVRPIDRNDLPEERRQHGFDNLDFDFAGRGPIFDGKCMVTISLPDYLIAGIATGQFGGDGRIWSVRFDDWRVRYDAIVTNEPDASSIFDMYLGGDELTYLKEPCGEADTQPRFFLHVRPIDRNDLPEDRRQHGFANLDFDFVERGKIFDGKCMASIALPDYPGAGISTGQFTDDGQIWKAEFPAGH